MRKIAILLVLILGSVSVWYGWLLWQNNRSVAAIDRTQLSTSLNRAIDWLEENRATIENQEYSDMLFWMLKESAEIGGNPRLVPFRQEYLTNHANPMLDPGSTILVPTIEALAHLPEYNLLFLYGSTCDRVLGSEPIIQKQLDPGFCEMHFLHPRCVTHQLIGVRFMQRGQCGHAGEVAELIGALQDIIVTELTWDPRVGDAYIQRLATLMDSGAENRIKPIWVRRVLEAQNADGGWGDLDPIIHLPDGPGIRV